MGKSASECSARRAAPIGLRARDEGAASRGSPAARAEGLAHFAFHRHCRRVQDIVQVRNLLIMPSGVVALVPFIKYQRRAP